MKAYACVSGGVIFVPDEIERTTNKKQPVSYNEFIEEDATAKLKEKKTRFGIFGKFIKPKQDSENTEIAA